MRCLRALEDASRRAAAGGHERLKARRARKPVGVHAHALDGVLELRIDDAGVGATSRAGLA